MLDCAELDTHLRHLTANGKWSDILSIGCQLTIDDKARYLWAWPGEDELDRLRNHLDALKVGKILSVGCGSGLLEWIIQSYMDVKIYGLEVDADWWESSYSPEPFIKLSYLDNKDITEQLLNASCDTEVSDFALMFCYFNNGEAFRRYMEVFRGKVVILIGPVEGSKISTDPMPLDPVFNSKQEWKLYTYFTFSSGNILSIYTLLDSDL